MKKQVQVKVEDTGGKSWTLTGDEEGVRIEAPVSLKTRPIPYAELRHALDELEGKPDG